MVCQLLQKIKDGKIDFNTEKSTVYNLYYELCSFLQKKYGMLNANFDSGKCTKRGKEWLDIHHICEMSAESGMDNIATRTNRAKKENDLAELKRLADYNKVDKLIYANKVEHFALHYLIDIYRGCEINSGGCWLLLPNIFDMEYKKDFKRPHDIEIQKNKKNFFDDEDFKYLFELAKILKKARNGDPNYDTFIETQAMCVWVSNIEKYLGLLK